MASLDHMHACTVLNRLEPSSFIFELCKADGLVGLAMVAKLTSSLESSDCRHADNYYQWPGKYLDV